MTGTLISALLTKMKTSRTGVKKCTYNRLHFELLLPNIGFFPGRVKRCERWARRAVCQLLELLLLGCSTIPPQLAGIQHSLWHLTNCCGSDTL